MAFRKSFVVRWSECDLNGHLRNTAYSEYGIETRIGFLADGGFPVARFAELGFGPVIQREEIDYLRELRLGDAVQVDLKGLGTSPEGARFKLSHDFYVPDGTRVARIVLLGGWLDLRVRKLTAPPPDLHALMLSLDRDEPFEALPPIRRREG
jgi:acyl-CoA thioester hydrolase